ncbi:hypothetical protein DDT91_07010, partial [Algoriphagus sp. AK58]|nr:hypothetical protein [Algoriphagus sp. AK58]
SDFLFLFPVPSEQGCKSKKIFSPRKRNLKIFFFLFPSPNSRIRFYSFSKSLLLPIFNLTPVPFASFGSANISLFFSTTIAK